LVKFTNEQGAAWAAIQELINEWARDLDLHNGQHVGQFMADDVHYAVGATPRLGRADVEAFYRERLERLSATPEGPPTHRHMITNLCIEFRSATEASTTFSMIYFNSMYAQTRPEAMATADVRMIIRATDGDWRIARFESNQPFHRN
jgi:hypothetical protein